MSTFYNLATLEVSKNKDADNNLKNLSPGSISTKNFHYRMWDKRFVIAFDPSYISKSWKKTPGLDWYRSGCSGQAKWGLEIGGLAAIDLDNHTAFHLEAVQIIIEDKQATTLMDWYINVINQRKETLCSISRYLVVDAWFSKKPFVDQIMAIGMHLISRLRDDADLKYLYQGLLTGKKGRPCKYAGKIDIANIDTNYFGLIEQNQEVIVYSAIVYSKSSSFISKGNNTLA